MAGRNPGPRVVPPWQLVDELPSMPGWGGDHGHFPLWGQSGNPEQLPKKPDADELTSALQARRAASHPVANSWP